jgi:hypothetical protein
MFEAPVRQTIQGIQGFYVKLREPRPLLIRLELTKTGIAPSLQFQSQFQSLQKILVSELVNNTQLFRVAPSLESLEAITPNWGFIVSEGQPKQSEYTHIDTTTIPEDKLPSYADLLLVGVSITRSTIRPHFEAKFVESILDDVIDFQWEAPTDVEEVSDIGGAPDSGAIQLRDPAAVEREKALEKERIREAFQEADKVKQVAKTMAEAFYAKYDLSDSESAFTGWMSDSSEEDELP